MRQQVRLCAHGYYEYCRLHEDDAYLPHEVDHIIAEKHGGQTVLENLAWSCAMYNGYKGSDIAMFDPLTHKLISLFNPHLQQLQVEGQESGCAPTGPHELCLWYVAEDQQILHGMSLRLDMAQRLIFPHIQNELFDGP